MKDLHKKSTTAHKGLTFENQFLGNT